MTGTSEAREGGKGRWGGLGDDGREDERAIVFAVGVGEATAAEEGVLDEGADEAVGGFRGELGAVRNVGKRKRGQYIALLKRMKTSKD